MKFQFFDNFMTHGSLIFCNKLIIIDIIFDFWQKCHFLQMQLIEYNRVFKNERTEGNTCGWVVSL